MADAKTTAAPDATQEIANPAEKKAQETNNNSGEMPQAAENPSESQPAASEEGNPPEEQETPGQDADDSKPDSEPSTPQTDGGAQEAARGEPDAKEAESSPDTAPQEASQGEEPNEEEEAPKSQDESAEQRGEEVVAENMEMRQYDGAVEETPKEENQLTEISSPKKVEEEGAKQGSELIEAKPVDAEASAEADDHTAEKVPEVADADTQEQPADNSNSNEDDNQEQEQQTSGEPTKVAPDTQIQDATPEEDQTTAEDPPADADKLSTPVPTEEPPTETAEDAQVSATTEPAVEELTDYDEVKYRAAQKDIEELRALNLEIQQRLTHSEEEARERKQQQASAEGKDGMKVQADYLARELSQQQDTEKYLREKLAEVLEEKEESERKCKDLQLRLKRFVKDDQAKDERMTKMEAELREISREVQVLEEHFDAETLTKIKASMGTRATNGEATNTRTQVKKTETPVPQSKTCTIL